MITMLLQGMHSFLLAAAYRKTAGLAERLGHDPRTGPSFGPHGRTRGSILDWLSAPPSPIFFHPNPPLCPRGSTVNPLAAEPISDSLFGLFLPCLSASEKTSHLIVTLPIYCLVVRQSSATATGLRSGPIHMVVHTRYTSFVDNGSHSSTGMPARQLSFEQIISSPKRWTVTDAAETRCRVAALRCYDADPNRVRRIVKYGWSAYVPKLVTVWRKEDIHAQAKHYVKSYILVPSGMLGLVCMLGGVGGLAISFWPQVRILDDVPGWLGSVARRRTLRRCADDVPSISSRTAAGSLCCSLRKQPAREAEGSGTTVHSLRLPIVDGDSYRWPMSRACCCCSPDRHGRSLEGRWTLCRRSSCLGRGSIGASFSYGVEWCSRRTVASSRTSSTSCLAFFREVRPFSCPSNIATRCSRFRIDCRSSGRRGMTACALTQASCGMTGAPDTI